MNPSSTSSKKRHDKWRNDERHYCATCNVWMGSDRQSIALHENGKKHKENVEFQLLQRRQAVLKEEKDAKNLQSALRQMEQFATARQSSPSSVPFVAGSAPPIIHTQPSRKQPPQVNTAKDLPSTTLASSDDGKLKNISSSNNKTNGNSSKRSEQVELNAWQERKQKRERDHASLGEETDEIITSHATNVTSKHVKLGELEGYYTIGTITFLEGKYYAPIFEPDMPIEIWIGAHSLNNPVVEHEMRQEEKSALWKAGLVVNKRVVDNTNELLLLFDVAYLLHPEDEDETFEENVHPTRLRLVIHPSQTNDNSVSIITTAEDPRLPKSIEEARLMLLGGEEEVLVEPTSVDDNDIDENTGFTKFQTVSIKRMTVSHEEQQQLEVEREKKRREKEEELLNEDLVKRVKMEEAKHLGAEDSALGAYDVWGTSGGGYKGVSITTTTGTTKAVTGKSLSKGTVEFKKKNSNSSKNRNNRRTTSAED